MTSTTVNTSIGLKRSLGASALRKDGLPVRYGRSWALLQLNGICSNYQTIVILFIRNRNILWEAQQTYSVLNGLFLFFFLPFFKDLELLCTILTLPLCGLLRDPLSRNCASRSIQSTRMAAERAGSSSALGTLITGGILSVPDAVKIAENQTFVFLPFLQDWKEEDYHTCSAGGSADS